MSINNLALYNGGKMDFYIDNYADMELQYDKYINKLDEIILKLQEIIVIEKITDDHKEKLNKYNIDKLKYKKNHLIANDNIYIDDNLKKLIILINIKDNSSFLNNISTDILSLCKELILFFKKNKISLFSIEKDIYIKKYTDSYKFLLHILRDLIFELNIIIENISINNFNFLKKYNFKDDFDKIYEFIYIKIIKESYKIDDTKKQLYNVDKINKLKEEHKTNKNKIENQILEIKLLKDKHKNMKENIKNITKEESKFSKLIKVIGTILIVTCIISLMFNIYTVYKKGNFNLF